MSAKGKIEDFGDVVWHAYASKPVTIRAFRTDVELVIKTLEGDMTASPGDYIIQGLRGEFYPCKPDVFSLKYQALN